MVLCFGELLLRLAPDVTSEWLETNKLNAYPSGSEINIAAALANWKVPVSYCTTLPENFLSAQLVKKIKEHNIDTSTIVYSGSKIGLYYLFADTSLRHGGIIYDKSHSSFSELKPGMIDWDSVFNGIRWFHFSAVSAALSMDVATVCKDVLEICSKKYITVSVDLSYRPELWKYGKKPNEVMPDLLQYCDVIIGDIWSVEAMLNIKVPESIHSISTKENYVLQAKNVSEQIMQQFSRCKIAANTFQLHKKGLEYFGTVFTHNNLYVSASYKTDSVVDKVGSDDCFIAGLIYGVYNHLPFQQVINFAAAAAFQKLFIPGDFTDKTSEEVKSFMQHYA
jgi:2-dehydro-3-deoxygluconokinase